MSDVDLSAEIGDLFDAGGLPLTDRQAEMQLLGFLLNKPGAVTETIDILRASDLHDPFHRRTYEMLLKAYEAGEEPSMSALVTALGGNGAGAFIAKLMADADMGLDASEVADHLQIISERRAIGSVDDISYTPDGAPIVSKFGGRRWEDIALPTATNGYTWLIENIVPMGEITLAFGDSGSGKTFGVFDMAMCVARGQKFFGHNVEAGLIVYVAAEAGKGFSKRKAAYSMHHNLSTDIDIPFYLCTKRPDFFTADTDVDALIVEIEAVCRTYRQKLKLIVFDTLSALAPGMNENASQDVSKVRARLVRINEHFNAAQIVVHHKPKGGSTPRGHGSLTADFETTIEFETIERVHRATVRKQREGKSGIMWEFTLPVVTVGQNKWGNDETSCVVEPYTHRRATATGGFRASPSELLFLEALFDAVNEHGVAAPSGLPASISRAVDIQHVREAMRTRVITGEADTTKADQNFRQAFKRAGDGLKKCAVIGFRQPMMWWTGKPVNGLNARIVEDAL